MRSRDAVGISVVHGREDVKVEAVQQESHFEHHATVVRDKLGSMGLRALKDPVFMQDWLAMLRHSPSGLPGAEAVVEQALLPVCVLATLQPEPATEAAGAAQLKH
jgi:hypothetical protein